MPKKGRNMPKRAEKGRKRAQNGQKSPKDAKTPKKLSNTPNPSNFPKLSYVFDKRNVVAKARTGSGKTAAYALPIIDRNLKNPSNRSIVMVPSKELCQQVYRQLKQLSPSTVYIYELNNDEVPNSQPDILVCTPTQLLKNADKFRNTGEESNYRVVFIECRILG